MQAARPHEKKRRQGEQDTKQYARAYIFKKNNHPPLLFNHFFIIFAIIANIAQRLIKETRSYHYKTTAAIFAHPRPHGPKDRQHHLANRLQSPAHTATAHTGNTRSLLQLIDGQ